MNPERTKLKQQEHAEQASAQGQFQQTQSETRAMEFANVDDLLRFDSEQNPVPPEVADRLGRSLEAEPKPGKPWYKKLFG
jgi:hypothetical protein